MDRKYTASEFCCAANGLDAEPEDRVACIGPINDPSKHYAMVFRNHHIADMLRQAAYMMERANNVLNANAKGIENRHRDADAVLVTAEYILTGRRC